MNALLLHASIVIYYVIAWIGLLRVDYYTANDPRLIVMKSLEFRYLTVWNFVMQTSLFFGYFIHDILETRKIMIPQRKLLKRRLDYYFYCLVTPTSLFVTVLFWALYSYDKEFVYIYPDLVDKAMPHWVNHALHTVIAITILIQALHNKQAPLDLRYSIRNMSILGLLYFICLYGTYFQKNVWIYPFISKVEEPLRLLMILSLLLFMITVATIAHYANKLYCNSTSKTTTGKQTSGSKKKKKLGK